MSFVEEGVTSGHTDKDTGISARTTNQKQLRKAIRTTEMASPAVLLPTAFCKPDGGVSFPSHVAGEQQRLELELDPDPLESERRAPL